MTAKMIRWAAAALAAGIALTTTVASAEEKAQEFPLLKPTRQEWSFAGIFGRYDQAQLQRGYQVYKDVCSSCHSMKLVKFRNLADEGGPGFSEDAVKVLAATYAIEDGPNDVGEMFERPRLPSDPFPSPFANDNAARAANGGALPPDMSLLAKARAVHRGFPWFVFDMFWPYQEQGPDYIASLLTGYQDPPEGVEVPEGTYYNPHFINGISLRMPPPLDDDLVEYSDGTPQTKEQYAQDVSAFLMWAAEPHLDARKELGLKVMLYLIIFAGILYFVKRQVWRGVPH
ncbi:cytochrome c1 [Pleomorphomonas sp. JP5]|uniref:cytochrome c1 n=1 Tax=Pleomorphomonas sp. JP5 TaxID=2942998 RepID=UPI00204377EF|nr:cytochrome c1 [Pleomorphomonas sp. JP5]MCM5556980.1 cytochrome c1 [Pleomorphomonas sp. JP5]